MREQRQMQPRELDQEQVDKVINRGEEIYDMFQTKGWKIANEELQIMKADLTNIRKINDDPTLQTNKKVLDILDRWELRLTRMVDMADRYKDQGLGTGKKKEEPTPIVTKK